MRHDGVWRRWSTIGFLGLALVAFGAAAAQETDPSEPVAAGEAEAEAESREDKRRRQQEDRAREYLIRRETELAKKELGVVDDEAPADLEEEDAVAATTASQPPAPAAMQVETDAHARTATGTAPADDLASPADVAEAARVGADSRKKKPAKTPSLPSALARAQRSVRGTKLGQDPTVQMYLGMVDRQEASPHQLAALGSFLAQNGMLDEALAYYHVAIHLEEKDPLLWLNLGTLHRQRGELSAALSAYGETLSLDPNNALAHYNVGAILDSTGDYQGAIDRYKVALTLDPSLGDPAVNPQAANNERLLAVKLLLYREQAGSLGLPLVEIPSATGSRPD
jgi:tetratricopeptide (TPR) repeat protein